MKINFWGFEPGAPDWKPIAITPPITAPIHRDVQYKIFYI